MNLEKPRGEKMLETGKIKLAEPTKADGCGRLALAILFDTFTIILTLIFIYWSFETHGVILFAWHPSMFALGFVFFMTEGILTFSGSTVLSRYIRSYQNRVFLHWMLQAAGTVCISIGFIAIVALKIRKGKNHFKSYHAIVGLIATIACFVSVIVGVFNKYNTKGTDYIKPVQLKILHSLLGVLAYLLGGVSMVLGLYTGWFIREFSVEDRIFAFVAIVLIWTYAIVNPLSVAYKRLVQVRTPY